MLQKDRMVFPISIKEYLKTRGLFIQNRIADGNFSDSISVERIKVNGERVIRSVKLHLYKKKFIDPPFSNYSVNIKEKVTYLDDGNIFTKKFTYEILNDDDPSDFVRFDYFNYESYPPLHINADEERWGNHLTYPDSTNLDLKKLDSLKALNIFQKCLFNPDCHLLDEENNGIYLSILK